MYPHDSSSWSTAMAERISQLAQQPAVVALGECGLETLIAIFQRLMSRNTSFPRS
ncbi:MAG: hypothetical protein ACR5LF_07155 [Symbiopectobacterium sp.]